MRSREDQSPVWAGSLLTLRFGVSEATQILRMSRAQLYVRIAEGAIRAQKDGARTYITRAELERYVLSCAPSPIAERAYPSARSPIARVRGAFP